MAEEIVQTVPFSFDEIYTSLTNRLGNDAPFEGSNLAQLMTSMSYLISMLNVNTAANVNELWLQLARKRENILEGARLLGYESSKKMSYRYNLTLTLKEEIVTPIVISRYQKFTSGELNYYYTGETPINIVGITGTEIGPFEVIQGDLKTFEDDVNLNVNLGTVYDSVTQEFTPKTYIDIPYTDVEDNGIELLLTYLDENGNQKIDEKWTKTSQFMIDKDSVFSKEFLRVDDIDYGTARVYFKYAGIGNDVRAGTIIKINIIISKGSLGEALEEFKCTLTDKVTITSELKAEGSDEENINSIKENAPLFFNTANRVITTMDYESFCNRNSNVLKSQVWGGDEEYPERPGEIWFSFIPKTISRNFTATSGNLNFTLDEANDDVNNFLEEEIIQSTTFDEDGKALIPGIWDQLDSYKIPTMKFHNRHPIYLDCEFDISVLKYNITKTRAEINEDIFNIIDLYFKGSGIFDSVGKLADYLEKFKVEFFITSLIKRIDAYLSDNSGFSITMKNSISIFEKNISKETTNLANADCIFQFGFPFESIFDSTTGVLLVERLPSIDTTCTIDGVSALLSTDFSTIIADADDLRTTAIISADIKHNNITIGKYKIFNGMRKYISINLYVRDDTTANINPETGLQETATGVYLTTSLKRSQIATSPLKLDIKFFSPNFKTKKNMLPRLYKVNFN